MRLIFLITLSLCLCACVLDPTGPQSVPPSKTLQGVAVGAGVGALTGAAVGSGSGAAVGAGVGALLGGWLGHLEQKKIPKIIRVRDHLARDGVEIIRYGEDFTIVLPADKIFYGRSPRIQYFAYPVLNRVAKFISYIPTTHLTVSGYDDDQGSAERNFVVSKQRAQYVANFLNQKHLDVRTIYARGFGSRDPIATNQTHAGRADNRRIEITFRCVTT